MRYNHDFPARTFLQAHFPNDIPQFLQRAKEMAEYGRIRLSNNGHQLDGPYSDLHQFNMKLTRSWGMRDGDVYVVLHAAKKRTTGQEPDYNKALALRDNYLTGPDDA